MSAPAGADAGSSSAPARAPVPEARVALSVAVGPPHRLVVAGAGGGGGCVVGAADRLPFRGGSFHAVACDGPLRAGTDAATAVAELARVAAHGGQVVLRARNRQHPAHLLATGLGRREPSPDEAAACTWGEVEELARPVLRLAPFGPPGRGRGMPVLRRLARWVVVHGSPR